VKFPGFKEFDGIGQTLNDALKYLRVEHTVNLKELVTGLRRLTFLENFQSFRVTVEIPATSEVAIENKIRDAIPTDRVIVRANNSSVVDGDTAWTKEHVYLKNTSATPATVTVIFFK